MNNAKNKINNIKNKKIKIYLIITLIFFILLGIILGLKLNPKSSWQKINGINILNTINSSTKNDSKITQLFITPTNFNHNFHKIKGNIFYNDLNFKIDLNGFDDTGETIPYSSSIYLNNYDKVINFSIQKIIQHSKNIILINFNIDHMNVSQFHYNLWLKKDSSNKKETTKMENIKESDRTNWTNILPLNTTTTKLSGKNVIPTSNGKLNGFVKDNVAQTGWQPVFLTSNYTFNLGTFAASVNYKMLDNFNDHYEWLTSSAIKEYTYDYLTTINFTNQPLILNYDYDTNAHTEDILNNTFTNSYFLSGKDARSNWKRSISGENYSLKYATSIENWFKKNKNFEKRTKKTLKIYSFTINTHIKTGTRIDSFQGKLQFFWNPTIIKLTYSIT